MHRLLWFLILLCIFITFPSIVTAECLACWSLHGVKVVTYKGDTITGYVVWNPYWLSPPEKKWGLPFPKNMMKRMMSGNKNQHFLVVYKNIYWGMVPAPSDSMFFTTIEDIDTIKASDIINIERHKGIYDALDGAGEMPILSKSSIKLLQEKPLFQYKEEAPVSVIFFLSYNEKVDSDSLNKIANTNWYLKKTEYENNKIIIIEMSYD